MNLWGEYEWVKVKTPKIDKKISNYVILDFIISVWVQLQQVAMLRACPNMSLAAEQNIKP